MTSGDIAIDQSWSVLARRCAVRWRHLPVDCRCCAHAFTTKWWSNLSQRSSVREIYHRLNSAELIEIVLKFGVELSLKANFFLRGSHIVHRCDISEFDEFYIVVLLWTWSERNDDILKLKWKWQCHLWHCSKQKAVIFWSCSSYAKRTLSGSIGADSVGIRGPGLSQKSGCGGLIWHGRHENFTELNVISAKSTPGVLFTKVRTPVFVRKFCVRKFLRA